MRWKTRPIVVLMAAVSLVALTGCVRPLFPENGARNQFEPYDRLHGDYVPQKEFDSLGRQRPNLRHRLRQR